MRQPHNASRVASVAVQRQRRVGCRGDLNFLRSQSNYDPCSDREAPLSDSEPIFFRPRRAGTISQNINQPQTPPLAVRVAAFSRRELNEILALYGRKVAAGEWRDYAIDVGREKAVFSVFRRSSEYALFRIEKNPRQARKQGAYSVIAATGLILKRGHDLKRVLGVLEQGLRLVEH